ncbi:MAG: DUF29 domain-containing protein [Geminicoccaceae bacterium]
MMATQIKPAPAELYQEDFYVWTERQAELLRARRFEDLDLEHLIEEVEELGDTKLSAVLNDARVVMEHLLKLQHSPATDPRNGRRATVREHRNRLEIELTPRLRQILQQELPRAFRIACKSAAESMRDHGEHAAADTLPETCPYTADQITGDWLP